MQGLVHIFLWMLALTVYGCSGARWVGPDGTVYTKYYSCKGGPRPWKCWYNTYHPSQGCCSSARYSSARCCHSHWCRRGDYLPSERCDHLTNRQCCPGASGFAICCDSAQYSRYWRSYWSASTKSFWSSYSSRSSWSSSLSYWNSRYWSSVYSKSSRSQNSSFSSALSDSSTSLSRSCSSVLSDYSTNCSSASLSQSRSYASVCSRSSYYWSNFFNSSYNDRSSGPAETPNSKTGVYYRSQTDDEVTVGTRQDEEPTPVHEQPQTSGDVTEEPIPVHEQPQTSGEVTEEPMNVYEPLPTSGEVTEEPIPVYEPLPTNGEVTEEPIPVYEPLPTSGEVAVGTCQEEPIPIYENISYQRTDMRY